MDQSRGGEMLRCAYSGRGDSLGTPVAVSVRIDDLNGNPPVNKQKEDKGEYCIVHKYIYTIEKS